MLVRKYSRINLFKRAAHAPFKALINNCEPNKPDSKPFVEHSSLIGADLNAEALGLNLGRVLSARGAC